jgi:predicted RNA-binding protein with PIN domain
MEYLPTIFIGLALLVSALTNVVVLRQRGARLVTEAQLDQVATQLHKRIRKIEEESKTEREKDKRISDQLAREMLKELNSIAQRLSRIEGKLEAREAPCPQD